MSALFESVISVEEGISATSFGICLVAAFLCGIICAFAASVKTESSKSFLTSLIVLPMIVSTVITMVNGNIGTGVAVMGAFSLIRFRSVPGKAKDIAVIFLSMAAGLACSGGYVAIALLFTLIVAAVLIALAYIPYGDDNKTELSITVPETLCYNDAFNDILQKYTHSYRLVRTKTASMGALFKLTYRIEMKNPADTQKFINELRCRNGNLEIVISYVTEGGDEL